MKITFEQIRKNEQIKKYIEAADKSLAEMGYTEHSFAHASKVANTAKYILKELEYDDYTIELAQIAAYLHDIGNLVNRADHAQSGALLAFKILSDLGMDAVDISIIVAAIGNHDEQTAIPVNEVAAALILGDKTDVRRSRVRNQDEIKHDIHDRVNYSVISSNVKLDKEKKVLELDLEIDTNYGSVMDFFEIFLGRMVLSKRAAEKLGLTFKLTINKQAQI